MSATMVYVDPKGASTLKKVIFALNAQTVLLVEVLIKIILFGIS